MCLFPCSLVEQVFDVLGDKQCVAFDDLAKLHQLGLVTNLLLLSHYRQYYRPLSMKPLHALCLETITGLKAYGMPSMTIVHALFLASFHSSTRRMQTTLQTLKRCLKARPHNS